jgi:hypothetical protein
MESPAERANRVEQALQSNDPDTVLEGRVAKAVAADLVDFNRKVGPEGEVDVETSKAIIEVTTRRSGKSRQMKKLLANPAMNPAGKPIILFAPNYGPYATRNIAELGVVVVRTIEELLGVLLQL